MDEQILSYFAGKRLLVTGASGFLATNLIGLLRNVDCTIVRLSKSGSFFPVSGKANTVDVTADVSEKMTFEDILEDVDIIYHFAAQTSVYSAEKDSHADFQANVLPMLNLLASCRDKGWRPTVIFSGTETQVGMPENLPINEACADKPVTIYDIHKLFAESYLKHYCRQGIVQGTTLRLANVYGPGPKASSTDRGVINMMVGKALTCEELTIYGKGDFLRDFIFIEDVVYAFLKAAVYIEQLNGQHFVIGSGQGHTIAEAINLVADRVAVKTSRRVTVRHIQPPPGLSVIESRNFVADTGRFTQATGWRASYSLEEGLDKTIEAFLERIDVKRQSCERA